MTPSAQLAGGGRVTRWSCETIIAKITEWEDRYGEPPVSADWNPSLARWRAQEWRAERYHEAVAVHERGQARLRRLVRRRRARRPASRPPGPVPVGRRVRRVRVAQRAPQAARAAGGRGRARRRCA